MKHLAVLAAAAGLVMLAVGPAVASTQNLTQSYQVQSVEFQNSWWAESTVAHNWYISTSNLTEITPQTYSILNGSTGYQQIKDHLNGQCLTMDWAGGGSTNKVLDETCVSGKASQLWGTVGQGFQTQTFYNKYMNTSQQGLCGSNIIILRAQTATAGLNMACPQSGGLPWQSQLFAVYAA